jgi:hypothetical protein
MPTCSSESNLLPSEHSQHAVVLFHRLTVQGLASEYKLTEGRTKVKHMGVDANMFIRIQCAPKCAQPAGALHARLV